MIFSVPVVGTMVGHGVSWAAVASVIVDGHHASIRVHPVGTTRAEQGGAWTIVVSAQTNGHPVGVGVFCGQRQ